MEENLNENLEENINEGSNNETEDDIKEFSDDSLREIAKEIVVKRTALKFHFYTYIGVNILTLLINFLVDFSYKWFLWVLVPWGLVIVFHAFNFYTFRHGTFTSGSKAALWYNTVISVLVSVLLAFIDIFTQENMQLSLTWSVYAILPLFAALIIHFSIYFNQKPKKNEDPKKGFIDRKVEKELSKLKKE